MRVSSAPPTGERRSLRTRICLPGLQTRVRKIGLMVTTNEFPRGEVRCSYHPDVMTGLRCSRCGKPICPRCGVRTPVGLRCPDCAGVRGLPTYSTSSDLLLRAAGAGLLVAIAVGIIWPFAPSWKFYLCLVLGFGVAEAMARASREKRGLDLQIVGFVCVTVGILLSRVLIARHLGITWAMAQDLNGFVVDDGHLKSIDNALQLNIIPDGIFAALCYVIVWVRFR